MVTLLWRVASSRPMGRRWLTVPKRWVRGGVVLLVKDGLNIDGGVGAGPFAGVGRSAFCGGFFGGRDGSFFGCGGFRSGNFGRSSHNDKNE